MFRIWAGLPLWAAALNGYLSGLVFFTLSFSWFGETAAALVGPLGFVIDLGPALGEAFAFAFAACVASLAPYPHLYRAVRPLLARVSEPPPIGAA